MAKNKKRKNPRRGPSIGRVQQQGIANRDDRDRDREALDAANERVRKKRRRKKVKALVRDASVGIRGKQRILAPDRLRPNKFNYKEMSQFTYEKLKANLAAGFIDPITVRSGDENGPFEDGQYEIINGFHRWKAAQELEMEKVRTIDLGNVPDEEAKQLMIVLNELHGKPDQDQLAVLVKDLAENAPSLLELLPYDEAEIDAFKHLEAQDWDALDNMPPGTRDDGVGDDEDADDEEPGTADFLRLDELTYEQDIQLRHRCEALAEHIKYPKLRPGAFLDRLVTLVAKRLKVNLDDEADEE